MLRNEGYRAISMRHVLNPKKTSNVFFSSKFDHHGGGGAPFIGQGGDCRPHTGWVRCRGPHMKQGSVLGKTNKKQTKYGHARKLSPPTHPPLNSRQLSTFLHELGQNGC